MQEELLWQPKAGDDSPMARFARCASTRAERDLSSWEALYRWSIEDTEGFWSEAATFLGIIWQAPPTCTWKPPPVGTMRGSQWFANGRLNYAENLLAGDDLDRLAVIACSESLPPHSYSLGELRSDVAKATVLLQEMGIKPGERVCGVVGNGYEAIVAALATAAAGGVWASCSPDFGTAGIIDRFAQIEPKVIFFTMAYDYGGKTFDGSTIAAEVSAAMPDAALVKVAPYGPSGHGLKTWLARHTSPPSITYVPRAFSDPLFVMFSSGTTGRPKCIVHSVGGTLLQHKKELVLHGSVQKGSRLYFFTTCGWMMWNWQLSALACGAAIITYDGSPSYPEPEALFLGAEQVEATHLGLSPRYIAHCMKSKVKLTPKERLQTVFSTGAPLLPEHFHWIYDQLGANVHLASISGGTDIISCFMLGNPLLPVRTGEIQSPGLGMAIEAWGSLGQPLQGEKGELVCTKPFPSMPTCFWNDPDGERYRQAYFATYPDREVWHHGDWVQFEPSGGVVVWGRSDTTLNPGGVRIGTAEIYRVVERLPEIVDSVVCGFNVPGDVEVALFVRLSPGNPLDEAAAKRIRQTIRQALTPRHVPRYVDQVEDIPYTRSGKKVEKAVQKAINGEVADNLAALINPGAIKEFEKWGERIRSQQQRGLD